jgi:hypothetical protein
MFSSDTLASAASGSPFDTTEPQLIADTEFRAPEFPAAMVGRDHRRAGVKAEIERPASWVMVHGLRHLQKRLCLKQ